jgi:raffinose/stachyose/melibiose transport system permease protein
VKRSPIRAVGVGLIWLVVAANLALLIWMALTSVRSTKAIFAHPFALPHSVDLGNFSRALQSGGFGRAAVNSLYAATASSVLAIALAAPAAYMLARRRTPLFLGISKINLADSLNGLILVYVGLAMPFTVYLLTGFFSNVPKTLEEAAAIDGASGVRTFVSIILPVMRGGLITAFLLQFISGWNETLFAIVLIHSPDKETLPVALVNFVEAQQMSGLDWGTMFAGMCLIVAPMIALFSWLGSRIIQGMTVGIGK